MRAQCLSGRASGVREAVAGAAGLQAQDTRASRLAVRARCGATDAAAVRRATNAERSVVRTWAMRGTLHMLPAEDVAWIVALFGPALVARDHRRRLQLGLDDDLCARALPAIAEILAGGIALTRAELVARLAETGVRIELRGQAPAHLAFYAAAHGLVCRGPDREDDEPTYVLLAEWVPAAAPLSEDDALAALARRYVRAYGPAAPEDFAAWAGLPLAKARRGFVGIESGLASVEIDGAPAWRLVEADVVLDEEPPCLRLLPAFDTYLLGYRSRELALDPRFAKRIQAGGGIIHPAVVVNGRVVGTWRQERRGKGITVAVAPFAPLDRELLPQLEAEVEDVGRFLGVPATLALTEA